MCDSESGQLDFDANRGCPANPQFFNLQDETKLASPMTSVLRHCGLQLAEACTQALQLFSKLSLF